MFKCLTEYFYTVVLLLFDLSTEYYFSAIICAWIFECGALFGFEFL